MIPSIPDKFYKLLVLLGIILIGFSFYTIKENEKNYFNKIDTYNNIVSELKILELEIENEENKLIDYDDDISIKYNVKKSIKKNKNGKISFTYTVLGEKNSLIASKLMTIKWDNYEAKNFKFKILNQKRENYATYLKDVEKHKLLLEDECSDYLLAGIILFSLGLITWLTEDSLINSINEFNKNKKINEKLYTNCQSCGMRFSSARFYGKNKDESNSNAFCEDCYQNGEFTEPELTLEQVKEKAKPFIKTNFLGRSKLNHLNRLERFNRNKYFD